MLVGGPISVYIPQEFIYMLLEGSEYWTKLLHG